MNELRFLSFDVDGCLASFTVLFVGFATFFDYHGLLIVQGVSQVYRRVQELLHSTLIVLLLFNNRIQLDSPRIVHELAQVLTLRKWV